MKKFFLLLLALIPGMMFAQLQLPNGGFEDWDENEEPSNWNTFLTAQCDIQAGNLTESLCNSAKKIKHGKSTEVRPGSEGQYSCYLFAQQIMTFVANGNITTGQIRAGSTTPTSPENYNITRTQKPEFNQPFTGRPDSIKFWARLSCPDTLQTARMSAMIHDAYDVRDPEKGDSANCANHIMSTARLNFPRGDGQWKEYTVPFIYQNTKVQPAYILLTFATCSVQGGGSGKDTLFVDDIEFVYVDHTGLDEYEVRQSQLSVYPNPATDHITVSFPNMQNGKLFIYNIVGEQIMSRELADETSNISVAGLAKGIYMVRVTDDKGIVGTKKLIIR